MTDINHYAEAVQYLALAEDAAFRTAEGATALAAIAQVHATLAAVPPYPQTAEDLRGAQAEIDRLRAFVDGVREPSEEMVEMVARVLNAHLYADREDDGRGFDRVTADRRSAYLTVARRVLAAIGDTHA